MSTILLLYIIGSIQVREDFTNFYTSIQFISFKVFSGVMADQKFITCDFDLVEKNPSILDHLPKHCKEAYKNVDLANKMLQESIAFQKFQNKLDEYEIECSDEPLGDRKLWKYRYNIYDKFENKNSKCYLKNNESEFIECLIKKRQEMIDEIKIQEPSK